MPVTIRRRDPAFWTLLTITILTLAWAIVGVEIWLDSDWGRPGPIIVDIDCSGT
jgi:hypothetical protein